MTNCSICNFPCAGHADSSNPFCAECLVQNFAGNEYHRTWLDDDPPSLTLTPRQVAQMARLVAVGRVRQSEETL
jgi:hypothetical protein